MQTRRRFITVVAGCAGSLPFGLSLAATSAAPAVSVWKGQAMGALASMTLVHPDRSKRAAQAQLQRCVDEIERLEAIFSLYRPDTALVRLNAAGELLDPPHELLELLSFSLALARESGGAFDPSVQPLYRLYAEHHANDGAAFGPTADAIGATLARVGFDAVEVSPRRIRLRRRGMALTLNGVAQGFITDRIATLLQDAGFDDVLIDLGEARALGRRPDRQPWRAAIADPRDPHRFLVELPLGERGGALAALATSAGRGTPFGSDVRVHHLLDPHTGRSANHHASVSVAAHRATLADGLSTTLSIMRPEDASRLLESYPDVRAYFVDAQGGLRILGAA